MAVIETSETEISNVVVLPNAVTVITFVPAELLSNPDTSNPVVIVPDVPSVYV